MVYTYLAYEGLLSQDCVLHQLTLSVHAPEGFGSRSLCVCVWLSVCLSVTTVLAISFICYKNNSDNLRTVFSRLL